MSQVPSELRHGPELAQAPAVTPKLAEGRSYWHVVLRAFSSRWSNLVAVAFILGLALLAVFVPFIANSHPYTALVKTPAGGWRRVWPLFAALDRLDISLLGVFVLAVGYGVMYRARRGVYPREERVAARMRWLLATVFVAAGLIAGMWAVAWSKSLASFFYAQPGQAQLILPGWWPVNPWTLTIGVLGAAVLLGAALLVVRMWRAAAEERRDIGVWIGGTLAAVCVCVLLGAWLNPGEQLTATGHEYYVEMLHGGAMKDAAFAPVPWGYADQEPLAADMVYRQPTSGHLLGTDGLGRDAFARLLWSSRVVMGIGFIAETISLVIGVAVGAIIGYSSGIIDLLGMRLIEIFESIPAFVLILIFVAAYGRDIFMIMVILGLVGWTSIARFVRAEFLRIRKLDYVQAAIANGLPLRRVLFRHMLPNGLTPVIVMVTFGIAGAVMSESGLSFLGVGVEPPTPSWGSMLNEAGNPAETFRWWLAIAPGLMIFLTVFAYNIIGEGARDALDPRLNKLQ